DPLERPRHARRRRVRCAPPHPRRPRRAVRRPRRHPPRRRRHRGARRHLPRLLAGPRVEAGHRMTAPLAVRELVMAYDGPPVIEGLDLEVPAGSFAVVVGPNGCGKSTLLRALARTLRPRAGEVLLDGEPVARLRGKEVARRVALLPQSP